jgi:hypothetical protein
LHIVAFGSMTCPLGQYFNTIFAPQREHFLSPAVISRWQLGHFIILLILELNGF